MDIDAVFDDIKDGILVIVKNAAKAFANEAEKDLKAFLRDAESDLKRYTRMLKNNEISKAEYKFLVQMKVDGAEMLALSAAGIARARVKHLVDSIRDLIVSSVFAAL